MSDDLERRLAAARERVRELSRAVRRDAMDLLRAAWDEQLTVGGSWPPRSEQYGQVIDIGLRWDTGAPLPHVISNGSRAFVVCLASQHDRQWDGTCVQALGQPDRQPRRATAPRRALSRQRPGIAARFIPGAVRLERRHGQPAFRIKPTQQRRDGNKRAGRASRRPSPSK